MASASTPDAAPEAPRGDIRSRLVDALMALAAERRFEDISISDIAERAGVSLAQFRECFPSKGAILGAFSRRIDGVVLAARSDDLLGEPAKERLFDVLMRRLDAMTPWRAGLKEIVDWARREPLAAAALNREALNSMRFMLEAAGIDTEGPIGAIKLQGLVVAWMRVLNVWFRDEDPGQAATMAALDKELTRGEGLVGRFEDFHRLTSPLRSLARAVFAGPRELGERMRERTRRPEDSPHDGEAA
jgi:AcrR family transcriptional regulator